MSISSRTRVRTRAVCSGLSGDGPEPPEGITMERKSMGAAGGVNHPAWVIHAVRVSRAVGTLTEPARGSPRAFGPERLVQVVAEDLGPGRVAQLEHRLRLDLPDPLPGDPVDLADLVQRLRLAVGQAEPHRDHPRLALG